MAKTSTKSSTQKLIEELYTERFKKPMTIKDIMVYLYINKEMSLAKIAAELHVSTGTVHNWLVESGITARKMVWL